MRKTSLRAAVPNFTGSALVSLGPGRIERQSDIGAIDAPEYLSSGSTERFESHAIVGYFRRESESGLWP